MFKVKLIVRLLKEGTAEGGYAREVELPFVPYVGMKFKLSFGPSMWETTDGKELRLTPAVEEVIYNISEQEIACLFTVAYPLVSTFWEYLEFNSIDWEYF